MAENTIKNFIQEKIAAETATTTVVDPKTKEIAVKVDVEKKLENTGIPQIPLLASICRMTQPQLKTFLADVLLRSGYGEVITEDGFVYAKGDFPVLLTAHMDTVHKKVCSCINTVVKTDSKKEKLTYTISTSPEGIGGDDRCGIYMILSIIKKYNCSVLFCEDEEIGEIGSKKFCKTDFIKNLGVNFIIELDRKGGYDAVFYDCDNKDFTKWIVDNTNFVESIGSCSDISSLMPESKIAGVNFSCGYYNPHTTNEYIVHELMLNTINTVLKLLEKSKELKAPFEYVQKKYSYSYNRSGYYNGYNYENYDYDRYDDYDHYYNGYHDSKGKSKKKEEITKNTGKLVSLEVVFAISGVELTDTVISTSTSSCWGEFFLTHQNICFADVIDYECTII